MTTTTTTDSPQHQASLAIEGMSLSEGSSSHNDSIIQKIKVEYKSCVETGEITPRAFATERIRGILLDLSNLDSPEKKEMQVAMIEATVQPCDVVLNPPVAAAAAADKETTFRHTQVQMLLRLSFWARLGDSFVRHYRKLKLSRKKKRGQRHSKNNKPKNDDDLLLSDVCDLFSMLAMKLPQSRPFSTFLNESLDRSLYDGASKLPKDLFSKIYQHFEILDPSAKAEKYFDFATAKPRRPKRRESSSTVSSAGASLDKSSQSRGANASEKQKTKSAPQGKPKVAPSINLLAPAKRKNSILGGGATQFVGSHFNTTLTNMSSLFREVSTGKQQTRVSKAKQPGPPRPRLPGGNLTSATASRSDQITVAAGKRKSDQCFQTPQVKKLKPAQAMVRVDETPVPSRKNKQCFQMPQGALAVPRSKPGQTRVRVDETPVPHRQRPSVMLDLHAARKVVVEARSALRRQK